MSPTRGNSRILEAGRRRSGPADCGSLARTELVAGCVPDHKNEVVAPILVAIREADADQGRRESEVVATVVASTTVAVAAASLGDFAVTAAVVNSRM